MIELTLTGHLGNDAKSDNVGGKHVSNFSAAAKAGEKTVWVDCSVWEKEKLHPFLTKGTQVLIKGFPSIVQYKNSNGEPKAALKVTVNYIELLGKPSGVSQAPTQVVDHSTETDLPF
jgi:single-strand DNA-binding protein